MSNLGENVQKVSKALADIKSAIELKTGSNLSCVSVENYADLIKNIETSELNVVSAPSMITYKRSAEQPSVPVGGSWDGSTFIHPEDWGPQPVMLLSEDEDPLWISVANPIIPGQEITWNVPEKISGVRGLNGKDGKDGKNGIDGTNTEYKYTLTTELSIPSIDDFTSEIPMELSEEYPYQWVIYRKCVDGVWGEWSSPTVWSHYGKDGSDGVNGKDALNSETIYYLCDVDDDEYDIPETPTASDSQGLTDWDYPEGWDRFQPSVTFKRRFVYSSTRTQYYDTSGEKRWGLYTNPILVVAYGPAGADGVSIRSTTVWYAVTDTKELPPETSDKWDQDKPAEINQGQYLWTRTVIDYTDDNIKDTVVYGVSYLGEDGYTPVRGEDYTDITVKSISYGESSSPTTEPTDWSPTIIEVSPGNYLWSKTILSDGSVICGVSRQGKNGENGKNGNVAPILCPAGEYISGQTYYGGLGAAQYVEYEGELYIAFGTLSVAPEGDSILDFNDNDPEDISTQLDWSNPSNKWIKMTRFKYIYADMGILKYAEVGNFIFDDKYLFSKFGKDHEGKLTHYSEYIDYGDTNSQVKRYKWDGGLVQDYVNRTGPAVAIEEGKFIPAALINAVTGESWFASKNVHFNSDGSGSIANGSIRWGSAGAQLQGSLTTSYKYSTWADPFLRQNEHCYWGITDNATITNIYIEDEETDASGQPTLGYKATITVYNAKMFVELGSSGSVTLEFNSLPNVTTTTKKSITLQQGRCITLHVVRYNTQSHGIGLIMPFNPITT